MDRLKLVQMLEEGLQTYSNNTAIKYKDTAYSYSQIYEDIQNFNKIISELPEKILYPVGLYLKNCPEFIIGYYSLVKSGVIAMLVDHTLKRDELLAIVSDCHLGGFLIHRDELDKFPLGDLFEVVAEYKNYVLLYSEKQSYNRVIEKQKLVDIVSCRFSSGTTGVPKCMMYKQENIIAAATNWKGTVGLKETDKVLCMANYAHGLAFNTSMLAPLTVGAEIHLMDSLMPRQIAKYIEKENITVFVAFPILYQLMCKEKLSDIYDLQSLQLCVSSGTVLHSEIKQKFKENIGIYISDLFGIAETGLCILNMTENIETVGKAISNVEIAIMDDAGNKLPLHQQGQIAIKSASMSRGYYNFPGMLESRVTQDGFYLSGDIATMDEEGFVFVKGRRQDFIDVAGKKVDPKEIEEALLKYDKISDIAVFGKISDKTKLEVICAAIVSNGEISRSDIVAFAQERLAPYKIPQRVIFLDKLPRNSAGKVLRTELSQMV